MCSNLLHTSLSVYIYNYFTSKKKYLTILLELDLSHFVVKILIYRT